MDFATCMKEGLSLRRTASICGIHYNTAFKWRHRFLDRTLEIKANDLNGIVELSEMYFKKSVKGGSVYDDITCFRGDHESSFTPKDQVCLLVGRDRGGYIFDSLIKILSYAELKIALTGRISNDVLLCSNSNSVYKSYARKSKYRHGTINISKGEVVKKDIVHLNNVHHYQHEINEWIYKRFRGVATKYLNNYLSWYRGLDEFNMNIKPEVILLRAKLGGKYKFQP